MSFKIVTSGVEEIGSGKRISATTIPQAIHALKAHVLRKYGINCQMVNSFRWDCWTDRDFRVYLSDGSNALELINCEGLQVVNTLSALGAQVESLKQIVPVAGRNFYIGLNDFLQNCQAAAKLVGRIPQWRKAGDGIRYSTAVEKTLRSFRQALSWARQEMFGFGPGVGSVRFQIQWQALVAQVAAFEAALLQRFEDVHGYKLCYDIENRLQRLENAVF